MSNVQYGGAIGFTTDFQNISGGFVSTPMAFIGVGNGGFGFDIGIYAASYSTVPSGTTPIQFYAKYFAGGISHTTAHFGTFQSSGVDGIISPPQHFYPSPQQVLELVFTYGTYDTVAHTVASDGSFFVYYNNSLIFSITGIALSRGSQWNFVELAPGGFATSYYIKQKPVRVTGYGTASYSAPGSIIYTLGSDTMSPPFTYPIPANFTFPADPDILEANNFSTLSAATYFYPTGRWGVISGTGGVTGYPILSNLGINVLNGTQNWTVAAQMLQAIQANAIENVASGLNAFNPSPLSPPTGTGTIIVNKVTSPVDTTEFNFIGTNLNPSVFILKSGDSQAFYYVASGGGYGIGEISNQQFSSVISVSNGSPANNITVAGGETVTVTVTNTFIGPFSGIYYIHPDKTNDTLYYSIGSGGTSFSTIVVAIPNPYAII